MGAWYNCGLYVDGSGLLLSPHRAARVSMRVYGADNGGEPDDCSLTQVPPTFPLP